MFLHVLDDLWDFHTKSLFLAFNIREADCPLFLFLLFQEFREPNYKKERNTISFSSEGRTWKEDRREESHEVQMGWAHAAKSGGRVGPTIWGLGHLLAGVFLRRSSFSPKSYALSFPELFEAVAAAELLILSEGGQILLLRSSGEGGNHRHRHHLSS